MFGAECEIHTLLPTAKILFKTSERHQKAGVRVYLSMRDYSNEYGSYIVWVKLALTQSYQIYSGAPENCD